MSTISQLAKLFQGKRVFIPLLIGLGVAVGMIVYDFDPKALNEIQWGRGSTLWILLAIVFMLFRDFGYILRLRILSDRLLSWKQSFQLTFLWEFASAISPGIIGGTAAAFVLLAQEKIGTGRSTAIVLATSFLDVLFYVLLVPILLAFTGVINQVPSIQLPSGNISSSVILWYFGISYLVLLSWAVFVFVMLFFRPKILGNILKVIFSLPILKKWSHKAGEWEHELVETSRQYGSKSYKFWLKSFGATVFSWTARFAVVNCIILAFGADANHFDVYVRQLIMWCILLLPVTPGASGLAEAIFPAFLQPFFPNFSLAKIGAVLWRVISYYPYLIIGFVLFPIWIKRIISSRRATRQEA